MTNATKTVKKKNYPVIRMDGRGELIVSKEAKRKIDILHRETDVEWCGWVIYKPIEGSISKPETFKARVLDIYPMDIGSHAYTETENSADEICKMNDRCPDFLMNKYGLIHTHHNLSGGAYFSGTDEQELHDNVEHYSKGGSYYLSLIVACDEKYVARIVKLIDIPSRNVKFKEEGHQKNKAIKFEATQAMLEIELDVKIEADEYPVLMERIDELKKQAAKKNAVKNRVGFNYPYANLSQNRELTDDEHQYTMFEELDEQINNSGKQPTGLYSVNRTSITWFLRRWLDCDQKTTKELATLLQESVNMTAPEFDHYVTALNENILSELFDMFGEEMIEAALIEAKKTLMPYTKSSYWESEVQEFIGIIENILSYANKTPIDG